MALPAPIQATLARAIAAYIRDAPSTGVPAKLRRFGGFRDQALKPHRTKLIAALENDDFRDKVLDWLDDSPPLKADDAHVLAVAAKRENGWEEQLAGETSKQPAKRRNETEKLKAEVERERAKTTKLKEDLRAERERNRSAAGDAKAREARLTKEVRELRATQRSLEAEVRSLKTESERAARAAEKDRRALRREADRAIVAKRSAEERLAAAKREVARLNRRILTLESRLDDERAKSERARKRAALPPAANGPRRALKAPKGLLADAPKTLMAWLGTDGIRLIVDGYNVGKATAGFPGLTLEAMRKRLVDEVAKLARRHGIEATIVFDGADVAPGTKRLRRPAVKVEYSPADVIADDIIVQRVESAPAGPLIVATNDRELQRRVAALGATVATSDQLLALFTGRKLS